MYDLDFIQFNIDYPSPSDFSNLTETYWTGSSLLNEYDTKSGDYTWGGIARHDIFTSNSVNYTTSVDAYTIQYDTVNQGQTNEWNQVQLLIQFQVRQVQQLQETPRLLLHFKMQSRQWLIHKQH